MRPGPSPLKHLKIVSALMMREMSTRFGREGLGFAWIVLEPLAFCVGVLILWSFTKPKYEHGIAVAAFMMTGYMCLINMRHMISYSMAALQSNIGLMHHRQIKPLHIFISRNALEFLGTTTAFIVVYAALLAIDQVELPKNYLLVYTGWGLLSWMGMGIALIMAGLAMRFEMLERIVGLITYILMPLSGVFFMIAWLPPKIQEVYLYLPLPHPIEMLRAGVFGEFIETHYSGWYALVWGSIFNVVGFLLISVSRDRIDVE